MSGSNRTDSPQALSVIVCWNSNDRATTFPAAASLGSKQSCPAAPNERVLLDGGESSGPVVEVSGANHADRPGTKEFYCGPEQPIDRGAKSIFLGALGGARAVGLDHEVIVWRCEVNRSRFESAGLVQGNGTGNGVARPTISWMTPGESGDVWITTQIGAGKSRGNSPATVRNASRTS